VGELSKAGHHTVLVGGCVRDLLRGNRESPLEPKDWDVATAATPEQVIACFRPKRVKVIPTGIEHGTVTVLMGDYGVEVTTFRSESDYFDGRRPGKVEFHTDVEADLSRRDFTINAMAWDLEKNLLVDPFGGQVDLQAKIVRCVRSAMERFSEDGLRALRAVRFATVLDFALEAETEAAIGPTIPVFRKVALERVNQEFTKLVLSSRAPKGLGLLDSTGLLQTFFPEARREAFATVARAPATLEARLALLLTGATGTRDILVRLKFKNAVADEADALVKHRELPRADASDADLRRFLARVTPARAPVLLELARAEGRDVSALEPRLLALLAARPPLSAKELALDGKAIMQALGVGPSKVVGDATRHLLEVVLDDPSQNSPAALTEALLARFPKA
jgi:tRNA nucleotidyltransferase (CCA-adding enzyme)